jgi:hypothetical protein
MSTWLPYLPQAQIPDKSMQLQPLPWQPARANSRGMWFASWGAIMMQTRDTEEPNKVLVKSEHIQTNHNITTTMSSPVYLSAKELECLPLTDVPSFHGIDLGMNIFIMQGCEPIL